MNKQKDVIPHYCFEKYCRENVNGIISYNISYTKTCAIIYTLVRENSHQEM